MYCPKCGARLDTATKFCPKCGAALPSNSAEKQSASTPVTAPIGSIGGAVKRKNNRLAIGAIGLIVLIIIVIAVSCNHNSGSSRSTGNDDVTRRTEYSKGKDSIKGTYINTERIDTRTLVFSGNTVKFTYYMPYYFNGTIIDTGAKMGYSGTYTVDGRYIIINDTEGTYHKMKFEFAGDDLNIEDTLYVKQ
jgi:hypothetical protein